MSDWAMWEWQQIIAGVAGALYGALVFGGFDELLDWTDHANPLPLQPPHRHLRSLQEGGGESDG